MFAHGGDSLDANAARRYRLSPVANDDHAALNLDFLADDPSAPPMLVGKMVGHTTWLAASTRLPGTRPWGKRLIMFGDRFPVSRPQAQLAKIGVLLDAVHCYSDI